MTINRFSYMTAGILLMICLSLTGCPDGGNGEKVSWFSSVSPLNGATCVPVDILVTVELSGPLSQALADSAKVTLSDGTTEIPLTKTYNDTKTQITITPANALDFGKTYTASVELVGEETKDWTFSTFNPAVCDPPGPPTTTTTTTLP